jgi:hypothetical protein
MVDPFVIDEGRVRKIVIALLHGLSYFVIDEAQTPVPSFHAPIAALGRIG